MAAFLSPSAKNHRVSEREGRQEGTLVHSLSESSAWPTYTALIVQPSLGHMDQPATRQSVRERSFGRLIERAALFLLLKNNIGTRRRTNGKSSPISQS